MEVIKKYYPVTLANYSVEKWLIDQYLWKWEKTYARNTKMLHRIYCNLLKSKIKVRGEKFQFGVRLPISVKEAYKFDKINRNKLWTKLI